MAIRRSSTRVIIVKAPTSKRKTSKAPAKKKAAPKRRTSRAVPKRTAKRKAPAKKKAAPKRKTSRAAPKRKTSKTPAKKKAAPKRRTSRATKKAAPKRGSSRPTKKRRTSRVSPKRRTSRAAPKKTAEKKGRATNVDEQDTIADTHALLADWNVSGYRVEFRNRLSPIGLCQWRQKIISYSREFWTVMTAAEKKRTVIHEVAHAVVIDDFGRVQSHGKEWKAQMRRMGIRNPRAKETLANAADMARFSDKKVAYKCCGKSGTMTIRKFHSWKKRGAKCRCPRGMAPSTPVLLNPEDELKYSNYLKTRRLAANGLRVNTCGCH